MERGEPNNVKEVLELLCSGKRFNKAWKDLLLVKNSGGIPIHDFETLIINTCPIPFESQENNFNIAGLLTLVIGFFTNTQQFHINFTLLPFNNQVLGIHIEIKGNITINLERLTAILTQIINPPSEITVSKDDFASPETAIMHIFSSGEHVAVGYNQSTNQMLFLGAAATVGKPPSITFSVKCDIKNTFSELPPSAVLSMIFRPFGSLNISLCDECILVNVPRRSLTTFDSGVRNRLTDLCRILYPGVPAKIYADHCESPTLEGYTDTVIATVPSKSPIIHFFMFINGRILQNSDPFIPKLLSSLSLPFTLLPRPFRCPRVSSVGSLAAEASVVGLRGSMVVCVDSSRGDITGIAAKSLEAAIGEATGGLKGLKEVPCCSGTFGALAAIEEGLKALLGREAEEAVRDGVVWDACADVLVSDM